MYFAGAGLLANMYSFFFTKSQGPTCREVQNPQGDITQNASGNHLKRGRWKESADLWALLRHV